MPGQGEQDINSLIRTKILNTPNLKTNGKLSFKIISQFLLVN